MPTTASSTATSPIPTGPRWWSIPATARTAVAPALWTTARGADLVVKASGVGVFDELLEAAVLELKRPEHLRRLLGRGRARDAGPRAEQPGRSVPRRSSRATTWS